MYKKINKEELLKALKIIQLLCSKLTAYLAEMSISHPLRDEYIDDLYRMFFITTARIDRLLNQ
ncbi:MULTISPECIES: hypothetical protein [Pantoea]|jgi:hypothetical protein|uniref:Uncharacterized protein n=1 Tax=Pantoea brenneri TaxID=472694 RepID=A0A7Y6NJ58_9GAMM|nr:MULTISPECIES: hypothetical protein [Pantoea]MBZ6398037.1 hypothetical protein [Pantoea sp.]MBZ6441140.1 hypothetical protein [Pantoea sp.]MDH1089057.1 hypothetical protein [Pantoea brenneri]MDU7865773.1 hypothetical protein [Pantoea sp.]NUY44522.1 hypothetical protein [Pantoea brenneri]